MEAEFRRLVYEYQDRVYNQAFRMLGSREDAEDAAQDVFMRVYKSLDRFRGESKLSSWIFRITVNVCISRLRKKQRSPAGAAWTEEEEGLSPESLAVDETPGPEEKLEAKQTAEFVRAQLRSLPPKWAMAISLYHFDDLSYDEIAEVMNIPRTTAATYILRGRRKLAEKLKRIGG
jgi:RNA polymerase sigma-70 factor (ECF subfamily)